MSVEGVFNDAHEIYVIYPDGARRWVATFATKGMADEYAAIGAEVVEDPVTFEVVPV